MSNETNEDKGHRVYITLNSEDYAALQRLSDIGYLSSNKPTTLASRIVNEFLWHKTADILSQHEARKKLISK